MLRLCVVSAMMVFRVEVVQRGCGGGVGGGAALLLEVLPQPNMIAELSKIGKV